MSENLDELAKLASQPAMPRRKPVPRTPVLNGNRRGNPFLWWALGLGAIGAAVYIVAPLFPERETGLIMPAFLPIFGLVLLGLGSLCLVLWLISEVIAVGVRRGRD